MTLATMPSREMALAASRLQELVSVPPGSFARVGEEPPPNPRDATRKDTPAESQGRENLAKALDRTQPLLLRQPRPLTAHDEVIDTEKLTISRDFILAPCLVAA